MTGTDRAALAAALEQCTRHAQVLARDLGLLPRRFDLEAVSGLSDERRMAMDQAAYRFMKLQDVLGERVLPALLEATLDPLPPEAPFAQKLQRLERLGGIPSAASWRLLREARNSLAHEYPEHPEIQAALRTAFVTAAHELLAVWAHVNAFASQIGDPP